MAIEVAEDCSAFLLWAYDAEQGVAIREYLEQVSRGVGIEEGQPAGTVRNALVADLQAYPKMPGVAVLALMGRGAEAGNQGRLLPWLDPRLRGDDALRRGGAVQLPEYRYIFIAAERGPTDHGSVAAGSD